MDNSPPRRQDAYMGADTIPPSSDEEDDNRSSAEVFEDSMKAMLKFYKKLPTKELKDAHLRNYPAFKRWYRKYQKRKMGDNNEPSAKRPRGPPPPPPAGNAAAAIAGHKNGGVIHSIHGKHHAHRKFM